jgi:hypothetical protein
MILTNVANRLKERIQPWAKKSKEYMNFCCRQCSIVLEEVEKRGENRNRNINITKFFFQNKGTKYKSK